ncbi:MAG: hypothetical protein ACU0DB_03570 [Paracoccus sp. (in: a-proteobacteria)]|jgi:lysyl-tRNA synthetase class II|uniref:hypothetical protein n=1 Tax=unclassified Paracoccus (in: a-proteobacteria) TaxID=2688777 RepID=UPI000C5EFFB3|nr:MULTISPECIES: hypothetical protein [unclassified Paracoccus (in: a-proteobacteria)]MAN57922.1 hypothetical protein [Paracoccus sp. (in: a-proteobacteria)]MBA47453.1 hypothetical protein [Paracoccus sp. (in: a-proteobacteria)]MCS5600845.1 hypothetical protein [Paracoccus sp. (in: a-proteobacteria)]HIC65373.1 hypothetical protein [Paracoccus sp. (in: a-proteobacteria)]|tara:strand:+ start:2785 stop:3132 length:348 start_codon:yes stop_codon:yes gene_type:complete
MIRALILAVPLTAALAAPGARAQAVNDFPTNARAEYVFACMATNGENREMLDRCSCSIDQIATVLPYDDYVQAETVLRMQQTTGERASMFKGMAEMNDMVAKLRRAEAEAEILCF